MAINIDNISENDLKLPCKSGLTKCQKDRLGKRHRRFKRWYEISPRLALQMFGLPGKW